MLITSIPQYIQGLTNAKVDLTNTNDTVLYTAPSGADFNASVINSLLVSNDSGSADTITVTLISDSDTFSVYKLEEVGALSTKELLVKDLIMQGGEVLKVQAATGARLHVIASIQELSKTRVTTSALAQI
tara:strand:- start:1735 stop:2124 length:390 start_codon:yes stop_codon:yes gene_type:complete